MVLNYIGQTLQASVNLTAVTPPAARDTGVGAPTQQRSKAETLSKST